MANGDMLYGACSHYTISPFVFVVQRLTSQKNCRPTKKTDLKVSLHVPRIGLEPTCLAALAPETSASTISPSGQRFGMQK